MKHKGSRVTEGRGPSTVNGNVPPRRLANAVRRPREYLTAEEVERLMTAARSRPGRYGHRDATMILLAFRHGLRVSELVGRSCPRWWCGRAVARSLASGLAAVVGMPGRVGVPMPT